jgi:subtilisin family serine protease
MFLILVPGALATPAQAARMGAGLARALEKALPPRGVAVGVTLRRDGLSPPGLQRRAQVRARRQGVVSSLPARSYRIHRTYESLPGFAARLQRPAIEALMRHPDVEQVYLDGRVQAKLAEGVALVSADAVQARGYTGAGVNVAVLDTGIDTDHPDLAGDLVQEHCVCNDNPSPKKGCCPNGEPTQAGPGAAEDDDGHGTSVSGIITSDGVIAAPGVAPDAGIIAVKVLDSNGDGFFSDIAAGLDWVLTNRFVLGIGVVNLSLGDDGEYNNPAASPCAGTNTANAIRDLVGTGTAVFVSSGNEGLDNGINFPACVEEAISVGGVYDADVGSASWCLNFSCSQFCTDNPTAADDFVCHSNSGTILDILAPNYRTNTPALGGGTDPEFAGTSASSPYAAGEAALILEAQPLTLPAGIRALLQAHGPSVTNPDSGLAFTRSDVGGVIDALVGEPETESVPALPAPGVIAFGLLAPLLLLGRAKR